MFLKSILLSTSLLVAPLAMAQNPSAPSQNPVLYIGASECGSLRVIWVLTDNGHLIEFQRSKVSDTKWVDLMKSLKGITSRVVEVGTHCVK